MISFICPKCKSTVNRLDTEATARCPSCGESIEVPRQSSEKLPIQAITDATCQPTPAIRGSQKEVIRARCPHCQVRIKASPSRAGSSVQCPKCSLLFQIPSSTHAGDPEHGYPARASSSMQSIETPTNKTQQNPLRDPPLATKLRQDEATEMTSVTNDVLSAEDGAAKPRNYPLTRTTKRLRLTGLTAAAFQHPLDQQATNSLKMLKGFDWLVGKFIEYGFERAEYVRNIGSNVRVGPRQLPKIYNMLLEACDILDVPEPELYVAQGPVYALTSGHTKPYIMLCTGLLDVMSDDEIMAVIAHELGHIKCGHVLYYTMARFIGPIFEVIGEATLGIGKLVGTGVVTGLLAWQQRSEFSADRAALLVMQDVRTCISMLMKVAGGSLRWSGDLDVGQFLNQARAYHEGIDQSMIDRFYRFMSRGGNTHPANVERARALDEWIESREYLDILEGKFRRQAAQPGNALCPSCSCQNEAGAKFCAKCGTPLRTS